MHVIDSMKKDLFYKLGLSEGDSDDDLDHSSKKSQKEPMGKSL